MVMHRVLPFKNFRFSSKYSQNMRQLSCKIFNDFYVPEVPRKDLDYYFQTTPVVHWAVKWHNDLRVYERNQDRPLDIDETRNYKYYPAHPQYRALSHIFREYGLYRDEHRDFNEAIKAKHIAKGKVYRQRRKATTETGKPAESSPR